MEVKDTQQGGNTQQSAPVWALRYAAAGMLIFPVSAAKNAAVAHWLEDASSDPAVIEAWLQKWAHCDFGWALPADVVVVDIDVKHGKRRLRGLQGPRRMRSAQTSHAAGHDALGRDAALLCGVEAVQERGGDRGTGIDTRTEGGYVVLPLPRQRPRMARARSLARGHAPLLPAPAWLDCALREAPSARAPLTLAPRAALMPPSSDPWAQRTGAGAA